MLDHCSGVSSFRIPENKFFFFFINLQGSVLPKL
jgi:hypothetical protein